jgi:hypothetical protein
MCVSVTATLPAGTNLDALRRVLHPYSRALRRLKNARVLDQLPPGEMYFLANGPGGLYNTSLGTLYDQPDVDPAAYQADYLARCTKKLRQKGWGRARIERWVGEKRKYFARSGQEQERYDRAARDEANYWVNVIRTVVASGVAPHMGLLIHMYGGKREDEHFIIKRIEKTRKDALEADLLLRMEEEVLYVFHE